MGWGGRLVGLSGLRGWVKWVGLSVLGDVGWVK